MVIYADVVFLVNFLMDSFIILLTSIIIKKRVNYFFILLGGLLGSLSYCLLMFNPFLSQYYNPVISIFTIIIPILVVFRPKKIKEFLKQFLVINICAFFIGGLTTALFFYTNAKNYLGEMLSFSVENFSIKMLIFSCSFAYIFIKIYRIVLTKKMTKKQHIIDIKIKDSNNETTFKALVDTGNTLKEPMSNKHVIVLEFDYFKDFIPNEMKLIFYEKNENDIAKIYEALEKIDDADFLNNFRIIPFKSIGNENGILIGIKIDDVEILDDTKKIYLNNVYVGIANFKLTNNDEFNALINPEIFEKEGEV